jgi:hypothetical protein
MVAWTNVSDKAGIILAKWTGTASVVSSGGTITVTTPAIREPVSQYGVQPGDILCLPRQYVQDGAVFVTLPDEKARYQVVSVSSTGRVVVATHVSGPLAATYGTRVVDIGGPNALTQVRKYDVVQITTPPNDGAYEIFEKPNEYSPFRVSFGQMISQSQQDREMLPLALAATVGPGGTAFASADLTTASALSLSGSARPLFFSSNPSAKGTTTFAQLPTKQVQVAPGDILEFRDSTLGTFRLTVTNVEQQTLITLSSSIRSDIPYVFGSSSPPAVTLISGKKKQNDALVVGLADWEKQEPIDTAVFATNMNALLNPLLVNTVPPISRATEAKSKVSVLRAKVKSLYDQLSATEVAPVAEVDDMLNTFKAKGCDRAIDLLLQGKFSTFFGLDMNGMSYSGALQSAATEVAKHDLATSKFGASRLRRKLISTQEGTDADYDHSDGADIAQPPEPSAGLDLPSTPDIA